MSGSVTVVVPTIGRTSLGLLLDRLAGADVIVVDDRRQRPGALDVGRHRVRVLETAGGLGPAAARNLGWRAAATEWVAFVDDDVIPTDDWLDRLAADLAECGPEVGAVQGRVTVPMPVDRRPTDRERNVAGLADARWITADMAYRRSALESVGGFDERFQRAYREDSDLAVRVIDGGWQIMRGERRVNHPVGRAPWWASVAAQRGNRDDVLMRRNHGPDWRARVAAGKGMLPRHLVTTGLGALSVGVLAAGRRRMALVPALAWAALTADFAWRRIKPGPRNAGEVAAMLATSVAIPPAATFWHLSGLFMTKTGRRTPRFGHKKPVEAVLFDRDGTLIVDVPYNGEPEAVEPVPGAREALDRLRRLGIRIGIVSNQSGIGRGLIRSEDAEAVMARVEQLLGPIDTIVFCPHTDHDGCRCRKPAPGLVTEAADRLGVEPKHCVVVGDILSDVRAGEAAGARAVLVPNGATASDEPDRVDHVAPDLASAVEMILAWEPA